MNYIELNNKLTKSTAFLTTEKDKIIIENDVRHSPAYIVSRNGKTNDLMVLSGLPTSDMRLIVDFADQDLDESFRISDTKYNLMIGYEHDYVWGTTDYVYAKISDDQYGVVAIRPKTEFSSLADPRTQFTELEIEELKRHLPKQQAAIVELSKHRYINY